MNGINVELWDEVQFMNAREVWSELLDRSSSDKLFMSWEWLYTWWDTFANKDLMTLQVFAAYNSSKVLMGVAPLFIIRAKSKKFIETQRLQFIGNCWRGQVTMRTELQDFIVDKSSSKQAIQALLSYINSLSNWDEFVFSDLDKDSELYNILMSEKAFNNAYYRYAEDCKSYYLSLENSFDKFCQSIGKNTRLKLINRRKMLEQMGKVELSELGKDDIESSFAILNGLHGQRWGKPIFEGKRLAFNLQVAQLMAEKGRLNFSVLSLDDTPISVQYNYRVANHEYNIQAGFNEDFHNKISLGYLHFGYAIESAYKQGLECYDFLAGEGKNTQYKSRLTDESITIVSMQIVRNRFAKVLYRTYDFYINLFSAKN